MDTHAAIALRNQPVLVKYEQNIVAKVMTFRPWASAIDAYGALSFRAVRDLVTGFVAGKEKRQNSCNVAATCHVLVSATPNRSVSEPAIQSAASA